jgi:hypothetical protein
MLPQWTVPNNYTLGTFQERERVNIALPLASTVNITTSVISGSLPAGLRLSNNAIVGTPFEVARATTSKFVIRARSSLGILDRTFLMVVEGEDVPVWVTPEGRLPVGPNSVFFILDNSLIDFQLTATDSDLPTGEVLKYYIQDGDGELPEGIRLTTDGKLVGQVAPLLSLEVNEADGGYDTGAFSRNPYDFSIPSGNGLDTYFYDATTYDFSIPTLRPKKLNRLYEFIVTAADNVSEVKRRFQIYVVGDDFVRSDNTIMKAADGVFTADATYLRVPVWLTPQNLGLRRANNYSTVYLETLDQNTTSGIIRYLLEPINDDGSPSVLPPGLVLDESTGELAGIIPYQPKVTQDYKFTVNAIRNDADMGIVTVFATVSEDTMSGATTFKIAKLPRTLVDGLDDLQSLIGKTVAIEGAYYDVVSTNGDNEDYDTITVNTGLRPLFNRTPLTVGEDITAGNSHFFINSLSDSNVDFYLGKTISFSTTELHKIESITNYVQWVVSVADSASEIELNTGITGWEGDIESTLEAFFALNGFPAYVSTISGPGGVIEIGFNIPSTATTRNSNYIKSLFHTADSGEVLVQIIDQKQRVGLDAVLVRNLGKNRQISFGAVIGTSFNKSFPRAEVDIIEKPRTFTIRLLGETDSTIKWITSADLGVLAANRISTLKIEADTSLTDSLVRYSLISGALPPGLELKGDGEIIGKVPIFGTEEFLGLTFFDNNLTTFDGETTTYDRVYEFTVLARDRLGYSAIEREFRLKIDDSDQNYYSNIYMKPFMEPSIRNQYTSLVNSSTIIDPTIVYRPNDPNFGVQRDLKSLVYAGIETKTINEYVAAAAKNHKRKHYNIGALKTAVAKQEGTNNIVYEVVYLELVDPANPVKGNTRNNFRTINRSNRITADSVKYETKDDTFNERDGSISITVPLANGDIVDISLFGNTFTVQTRSGTVDAFQTNGNVQIVTRTGEVINLAPTIVSSVGGDGSPWRWRPKTNTVTTDSNAIQVDQNTDSKKYISNINNMRNNISQIGTSSRDFLPLWMRTPQAGSLSDLDYVFAIPLVYTLPGYSEIVKANIENQGFDFRIINYDIDRYIIDSTTGNSNEQYIIFANYSFNV